MEEVGYKIHLELGTTDLNNNRKFISYNQEIELDQCSYSLIKEYDARGKITSDVKGGNVSFSFSGIPPLVFIDWAITPNRAFSGYIHFRDTGGNPKCRVFFENAVCIYQKIVYTSEGQQYMLTQCTIQAESLQLPGAKVLLNNWNHVDDLSSSSNSLVSGKKEDFIKSALNLNASITGHFLCEGKSDELRSFEVEFCQEIDHKGEPQTSVKGGVITIGLYDLPSEKMNNWMMRNNEIKGRILFGDAMRGYEMTMELEAAKCSGYYADVNSWSDDAVQVRLNITPQSILFTKDLIFRVPYF